MNYTKKILLVDSIHPVFKTILEKHGFSVVDGTTFDQNKVKQELTNYNGIVIRSRFKMDKAMLAHPGKLSFIARAGAGMENIDVEFAGLNNITCFHAPEGNRDAVGEHALGMLLSLFRNLNRADREVRNGNWKREENRGIELKGKTIGVIGFGNMGSAFVRKLAGFEVDVLVYDKYLKFNNGPYYKQADMDELYKACDVLCLHVPLTAETRYLINNEEIKKYRKNFFLLNTSRGENVQTSDLVLNLKEGKILGAALDVLEYESTSFENIMNGALPEPFQYLVKSDKVILSPHIAGWTTESNYKIATTLAEKILIHYNQL